jgi:hypothetical protein
MEDDDTIHYNEQFESIIASEGERCLCYRWLHTAAERRFNHLNNFIVIPVIVLSTLAGTASVGSQSLFGDSSTASVSIGFVSILVGVMNTIGNYFAFAKRAEAHRIAAVTYAKIHRLILVELALPREERTPARDLLKSVRDQVDRLNETCPPIPTTVIEAFNDKFQHTTPDVSKPPETNGLDAIEVFTGSTDGVQVLVAQDEGKGVGDLRQDGGGGGGVRGAEAVRALDGREKVTQESV